MIEITERESDKLIKDHAAIKITDRSGNQILLIGGLFLVINPDPVDVIAKNG